MKHTPGFLALVDEARAKVTEISTGEYEEMRSASTPHVLIDVREDGEFAAGHAAGSVHLGKGIIERDIEQNTRIPAACWCFIAVAGTVPLWLRKPFNGWDTPTSGRSPAAGAPGRRPGFRRRAPKLSEQDEIQTAPDDVNQAYAFDKPE